MSLALDKSHIFQSNYHEIKLIATEFDEPFNGLTLWRFRLYCNNEIYNHVFLDYENKFCGLPSNLENFIFESLKGDYLFIPYGLLVINTKNLFFDKYEAEVGTNNDFIANIFIEKHPVVLRERGIYIVDLINKTMIQKIYLFEELKFEKIWSVKNFANFLYKEKISGETKIMMYNLEKKEFVND
ncbi:hypothetical protein [Flavobacterium davisii]|uniref:Uncharacterized protein n=1 Tax=Flavobacterium columnare TaxID=996 RepID=A0A8G0KSW9_9FLAO|nr:hypothetical protein [Flavobacterium davisii]QYS89456.1 hypothetical protein JJC05_04020 [Flavobacterium davisii]